MGSYDTAKEIFRRAFPDDVFRPQAMTEWKGEFPLPDAVAEYFKELGPVDIEISGYGNPYVLPSLSHLWPSQAGYRYHPDTHERFAEWDDDWIVIADEGGDPFIFSRTSRRILHAYHGDGVWEPEDIFANLAEMVTSFAIIGDIVASAGDSLTDDTSMILSKYRDEASARIEKYCGSRDRAAAIVSGLGWD